MLPGFPDPKIPPSIYLPFLSFSEICHFAQGPLSRAGATMYNPTENKSPRSNAARLLQRAWPRHHGAAPRPSEMLWRLWCSTRHPPPPDTSQPALTFSLFKYYWSLLAPVRGRGCADNDVPYAALPLQLSESSMDQLRHKSSWNLILLSPIWAEHPSSKSGPVVGWDVSRL